MKSGTGDDPFGSTAGLRTAPLRAALGATIEFLRFVPARARIGQRRRNPGALLMAITALWILTATQVSAVVKPVPGADDLSSRRVLLIYSYHPGFPTSPQSLEGIRSVFGPKGPTIDLEYLDAKRVYDPQSVDNFLRQLRYKMQKLPPYDLVMTADDYALRLALDHGKDLFSGLPVVFYGVNNVELALAQNGNPLVTGVVEASSFDATLQLHSLLLPGRPRVNVLVDGTLSGQADLASVMKRAPHWPNLQFRVLSLAQMTWDELDGALRELGDGDVILFLSAYSDVGGRTVSFDESLAFVRERTEVPLWHLWEHGVGQGMLGGVLISHREQGRAAAQLARRILRGESPATLRVVEDSPNIPVFDYRLLGRYGINQNHLPPETKLLNEPGTAWHTHRKEILFGFSALALLILFTAWLIRQNARLRQAQAQLEAGRDQLRTLSAAVEQSPLPVTITCPRASIEYVNDAFTSTTGYPAVEVIGHNPRLLASGQTPNATYQALWQALSAGRIWRGELLNRKRDGQTYWARCVICPVLDDGGRLTHYLGIHEDISLQRAQADRIRYQAQFDSLTDLPNRLLVMDRLGRAIAESRRNSQHFALMFLDLDEFKTINDSLGHEAGDDLLKQVAVRLRARIREEDTVGRLGGDEFVVIARDLHGAADADAVANILLEAFDLPFALGQRSLQITVSIGIALFPEDGEDLSTLLRKADIAMYGVKRSGRNAFARYTDSQVCPAPAIPAASTAASAASAVSAASAAATTAAAATADPPGAIPQPGGFPS